MAKEKPNDATYRVLRGFRSGDVVFIECERNFPAGTCQRIQGEIEGRARGIRAVILPSGMRVASRETVPPEELDVDAYRDLARSVREFLAYIQDSGQPQSIDNSRTELALILAMRNALDGVPK